MSDTITLGSILGALMTTVTVLVGLYMNGRKIRRETEADMHARDQRIETSARDRTDELKSEIGKHNDSVEKRLTSLETRVVDFMPRSEIEGKFEHARSNQVSASKAAAEALANHARDIGDLRVCVGKVEQKQDGMSADMAKLENLVRELGKELNSKLDRQAECLNSMNRKVS